MAAAPLVVVAVVVGALALGRSSGDVEMLPDPPPEESLRLVTDKDPGRTAAKDPGKGSVGGPVGFTVRPGDVVPPVEESTASLAVAEEPPPPGGSGTDADPWGEAGAVGDVGDIAPHDQGLSMIASATVPVVNVSANPPPGIENAPLPEWLPAPAGAQLPHAGLSIAGRVLTDTGWDFSNPESRGGRTAFWVVQQEKGWVRVMMPVRPNNLTGWISTDQVELSETRARVEINTGSRRMVAFNHEGQPIVNTAVGVGRSSSPTPRGWFSITDVSRPGGVYGPGAVGTSGLSEALESFAGGAPQITIHGWNGRPSFGAAISNGCIRTPNSEITKIMSLPRGTPVIVT
mgnify:CR=1 FL=1